MSPKRIVVFGGTGITGVFFCKKALEHGHQLTIYARNPSKLPQEVASNALAKIIEADMNDAAQISKSIEGQDVVVSFLGPTEFFSRQPPELFVEGYKKIFDGMRAHHVKRIYAIGTPYTRDPKDSAGGLYAKFPDLFFRVFAHNTWKSFVLIGELFDKEAGDLDWTIPRVARLTNDIDKETKAFEYIGASGWTPNSTRSGSAEWIVDQIDRGGNEYIHEKPAVGVPK